jgi:hypothetical protein
VKKDSMHYFNSLKQDPRIEFQKKENSNSFNLY